MVKCSKNLVFKNIKIKIKKNNIFYVSHVTTRYIYNGTYHLF